LVESHKTSQFERILSLG